VNKGAASASNRTRSRTSSTPIASAALLDRFPGGRAPAARPEPQPGDRSPRRHRSHETVHPADEDVVFSSCHDDRSGKPYRQQQVWRRSELHGILDRARRHHPGRDSGPGHSILLHGRRPATRSVELRQQQWRVGLHPHPQSNVANISPNPMWSTGPPVCAASDLRRLTSRHLAHR